MPIPNAPLPYPCVPQLPLHKQQESIITEIQLRPDIHDLQRALAAASGICAVLALVTLTVIDTCHLLFAFCVKIYSFDASRNLVEANVVETLETRAINRLHAVVRDKKIFFPTHK